MARRKRRQAEHINHERWIVSYADFITLLFAFFVVMYSISSVNEGKYRVLSRTLTNAFQETSRSLEPIQVGELNTQSGEIIGSDRQNALIENGIRLGPGTYDESSSGQQPAGESLGEMPAEESQRLGFLAATIEDMLGAYVEQELVEVTFTENKVRVNMKDKMLFGSGSATLSNTAVTALRDISRVLSKVPNRIQVEGNTDNRPIHTEEFPSNWELSATRAASVVHLMSRLGIAPSRLSAIGYGEHRPATDNDTEAGRARNRRVTLVILGMNGAADRSINLPGSGQ